jgi:hypothetical protein
VQVGLRSIKICSPKKLGSIKDCDRQPLKTSIEYRDGLLKIKKYSKGKVRLG